MYKGTMEAEVSFACCMIAYDQGAIEMAQALSAQDYDPEMKVLAEEIIAGQEEDIERVSG